MQDRSTADLNGLVTQMATAAAKPGSGTPAAVETAQQDSGSSLVDIARLLEKPTAAVSPTVEEPADAAESNEAGADDLSQLAEQSDEASETPVSEDDAEALGDGQGADEAQPDDETDPDEPVAPKGLTPAAQHAFNKIVQGEKARRKELLAQLETQEAMFREQIEQLRAENAGLLEARGDAAESDEPELLRKATDAVAIRKVEADAKRWLEWADDQLERLRFKPEAVEAEMRAEKVPLEEFTPEAMAEWLLKVRKGSRKVLEQAPQKVARIQRQADYAKLEAKYSKDAETLAPWLAKPSTQEAEWMKEFVQHLPEIKRMPNWKAFAAAFVEGRKVLKARAEKAQAAVAPKAVKPKAAIRGAEPVPVDARKAKRAALFSKVMKEGGSMNDIAKLLE